MLHAPNSNFKTVAPEACHLHAAGTALFRSVCVGKRVQSMDYLKPEATWVDPPCVRSQKLQSKMATSLWKKRNSIKDRTLQKVFCCLRAWKCSDVWGPVWPTKSRNLSCRLAKPICVGHHLQAVDQTLVDTNPCVMPRRARHQSWTQYFAFENILLNQKWNMTLVWSHWGGSQNRDAALCEIQWKIGCLRPCAHAWLHSSCSLPSHLETLVGWHRNLTVTINLHWALTLI